MRLLVLAFILQSGFAFAQREGNTEYHDYPGRRLTISPDFIHRKWSLSNSGLYLILPDGAIDYEKREDGFYGRRSRDYNYYERL